MSNPVKSRWLLVGGDTLLGKEIRDLVQDRKLPVRLQLVSTESKDLVLTADEDELNVMELLDEALLEEADVVLLGGVSEVNQKALVMARGLQKRPEFVDLLGELEDLPESVLRAPMVEAAAPPAGANAIHTLAHPAATALARLLSLLHKAHPLRGSVVTIFQPASERGKAGIDELHQQTVKLFNFGQMPKAVYDAQVSFNLLPRYGEESKPALASFELRMERHLASLLGPMNVPMPSVRLIQAPVFHGHCQNVWVEFESRPPAAAVEALLEEAGVDVRREGAEPVSNVDIAGQSGIAVSDIAEDRGSARGMWLWLGSDNVLTHAENALLTAGLLSRKGAK